MNETVKKCVEWAEANGDDFAELWDVDADDLVDVDPNGSALLRDIARSIRAAGDYFRRRNEH